MDGLAHKDVRISDADRLNVVSFSAATAKLAENDVGIFPKKQRVPSIWQNRWFSNPQDPSAGYSKGEAVWLNTEDVDEFVVAYEQIIREYAMQNGTTKAALEALDRQGDRNALLRFYKQMVSADGYEGVGPVFFLGDMSKPAQIRISLRDNNKDLPVDQSPAWRNFFETSTEEQLREQIKSCFDQAADSRMDWHLKNYHCSELSAPQDFLDKRLQSDFSNLQTDHKFRSHYWYQPTLPDGFDYVASQAFTSFAAGSRWFRMWNSGLLEHGGIIDTSKEDRCCRTENGITMVKLDWIYSEGFIAPSYAFPTDALNAMFYGTRVVHPGATPSMADTLPTEIERSQMGAKYRFTAQLTPWLGVDRPYENVVSEDFGLRYPKELCYISNSEFKFFSNGGSRVYSYHLRGFVRP